MASVWMAGIAMSWSRPRGGLLRPISLALGCALLFVGLLFLNARDEIGFKSATTQVVSVQFAIILLVRWLADAGTTAVANARIIGNAVTVLAVSAAVAATALTTLAYPVSEQFVARRQQTAELERSLGAELVAQIQAHSAPNEPIQVLVFLPRWYLLAQRRPVSGHYYYLPGQGLYDSHPVLGRHIDLCGDLRKSRPSVILFEDQEFPNGWRFRDYAPCVADLLASAYRPLELDITSSDEVPMPKVLVRKSRGEPGQDATRRGQPF